MREKRKPPTEKQAEVLRHMLQHLREQQRYPTVHEIAQELGIWNNAAYERLCALERKGWLVRTGKGSRGGWRIAGLMIAATLPHCPWMHHPVISTDSL